MTLLHKNQILPVILILVVIVYVILLKRPVVVQGVTIQEMRDSLRMHDRYRDSTLNTLRIQYIQDSFHIAHIQQQIDRVPEMINNVKKKYDEKRNHIDTISTDEQIGYMSKWLSEEGSNRP